VAQRTSGHVHAVAAASEEMTAAIQEIVGQVVQTSRIAGPCRLDGGVERQEVRLRGDVGDDRDDALDALGSTPPSRRHGPARRAAASRSSPPR
jgi:hypothetical protein